MEQTQDAYLRELPIARMVKELDLFESNLVAG
jgi:hypothetical protein